MGDLLLQKLRQLLLYAALHQQVVGSHTDLPGVEELAEDDTPGGQRQVGVGGDDHRTLAPQLQGHRGQVPGGHLHDVAAHRHTAGEKDIVEGLLQKGLVFRPAALHHCDPVVGQTGGDEFLQGVGAGRGVGRGFQDCAVAR